MHHVVQLADGDIQAGVPEEVCWEDDQSQWQAHAHDQDGGKDDKASLQQSVQHNVTAWTPISEMQVSGRAKLYRT